MVNVFPVSINTFQLSSGTDKMVRYPQVGEVGDYDWQSTINRAIAKQTQQLIEQQLANMPSSVEQMLGSFEIKNNQREVLSLSLSNYTYHAHAAHGMTYIKSLTFDFEKQQQCELKDLFKPGVDYKKRLSDLIQQQIMERDIPLLGDFTGIRPDQDFYIADKVLVIYFQLYEITPYVFGFPIFPISVYKLTDTIDENGPLGRMAENN